MMDDTFNPGLENLKADEKLAKDWHEMVYGKELSHPGIETLLNNTFVPHERLPMLEVVCDRLVRLLCTSLRTFTADTVEVSLDRITSVRFGDYMDSIRLPAMIGLIKAQEWNNPFLITVDSFLIYSVVDILLGGKQGTAAMPLEGRDYTTIERKLIERMMHVILTDMTTAFEPVCPVHFQFERMESHTKFALIDRSAHIGILVQLQIQINERGGMMDIFLPNITLEPVRELLMQMILGEKLGRDPMWEDHLAKEVWQTDMEIQATLATFILPLGQVLEWKIGSELDLGIPQEAMVQLHCGKVEVGEGRIGHRHEHISIQMEKICIKE